MNGERESRRLYFEVGLFKSLHLRDKKENTKRCSLFYCEEGNPTIR